MKKVFANLNYLLLLLMVIYTAFGLLMIFSASSVSAVLRYQVPTNYFVLRQLLFMIAAYIVGFVILLVPTGSGIYKIGGRFIYIGIGALVAIFSIGKVAGGAQSWFELGNYNLQPAEFIKVLLIVFFAVYYSNIYKKKKINLLSMLYPIGIAFVAFVLTLLQPDLGGALIIGVITALVFFSLPFGKKEKKMVRNLGIGGVVLVLLLVFVGGVQLFKSYQLTRFDFTKPCAKYSLDTGYQVCNGYIAIHNGGLTGVGLGNSTQKYLYLPEAHTDFIFPIICEELGLIVGILVVIGYFIMLITMLKIAKEADNIRNSILAYGIFCYFLVHILINLLGVLGLIPLTGVPLPFLSYGGSYNICVVLSFFILQRVHYENRDAKLRRKIESL